MNLQSLHESESLSRTLPRQNKHKCLEIIANIGRFDWQIYALYFIFYMHLSFSATQYVQCARCNKSRIIKVFAWDHINVSGDLLTVRNSGMSARRELAVYCTTL